MTLCNAGWATATVLGVCPTTYWILKGAWEVDQQWIISGVKQCSRHLNKKIGLPIKFFLEQTKKNIDQIPKKITHFIFGNEAPKAALSNYSIQYLRL